MVRAVDVSFFVDYFCIRVLGYFCFNGVFCFFREVFYVCLCFGGFSGLYCEKGECYLVRS